MDRLIVWAQALKRDVMTLWFALKHPQTPWYARVLATIVTAYALSPIDLIPDFIPILGYLDDLILVPIGVWLLLKWFQNRYWQTAERWRKTGFLNSSANRAVGRDWPLSWRCGGWPLGWPRPGFWVE